MIYTSNLLTGEKVRLAPLSKDDLPIYHKWFSNTEFLRLFSDNPALPKTVENRAKWYEGASKDKARYRFCIRTLDDDRLIGYCSIINIDHTSRNGVVAIYIGESSEWGKGYGTDALNILVRYAFMDVNLHRLTLYVFSYNQRAIRSYEKVGFAHEGVLPETLYRDGEYHHIHVMGILHHEWIAKHHAEVKIS